MKKVYTLRFIHTPLMFIHCVNIKWVQPVRLRPSKVAPF